MAAEAGKMYRCPKGSKRLVTSVDGDTVHWMLPISMVEGTSTLAEFEAWADCEHETGYSYLRSEEAQ